MTKPQRPAPPPLWKQPRPLAVAGGGLVGLIALIVTAVQLFPSGGPDSSPQRMEQWVDDYLAREQKESAAERHAEADKKVRTLVEVMSAPGFGKLPRAKQEAIRNRHRELRDYQEFEQALAQFDDPQNARNEEQLKKARQALEGLRVPAEYLAEWSGTPALQRRDRQLADIKALERTVEDLVYRYRTLTRDGRQVLATAAAANLPTRAKDILDRARDLPEPGTHGATPLPDSPRLTYAAAFSFASVADALAEWQAVRKKLEGVAGLRKP